MIRLAIDENFDNDILRGALRKCPQLDVVRVQDVGLRGAVDPVVLEWAAGEGRVMISHDVKTLGKFAYDRVLAGLPMPGVVEVPDHLPIGRIIDDTPGFARGREGDQIALMWRSRPSPHATKTRLKYAFPTMRHHAPPW